MGTQHQRPRGAYDELSRYGGLGLQFAVTLVVFGLGGRWLDEQIGTEPWLLIVGVFAGFGLGVLSLTKKLPTSGTRPSGETSDGGSHGPDDEDGSSPPSAPPPTP